MHAVLMPGSSRRYAGLARLAIGFAIALTGSAHAATVDCGVGDRVVTELSNGKVGTIEEIGTESPHVGWYRISFDWTPSGEWYPPATLEIHPQGSSDRCQPPGTATAAAAKPAPVNAGPRPAATAASPAATSVAPASGELPFGRYVCSTSGAGHFDIHLLDGSTYADRRGTRGSYAIDGERIRFASGSLADYYSRILGPAKFGLSSEEVRSFYVVCNLKP